ncbi:alpha/beta fold hydrolase [Paracoccus sp. (in: a-proteobacteria)]|uniref:alpha/beta hydrolase family protein n=1 Tax=Paracoccus sp. TaxID=267 RepID=UPI0028A892F4|nr:alpha/beta fold hydrolase [Paracoccus sp. (in: a-proteobacteria)]
MWHVTLILALALTIVSPALAEMELPWGGDIPREDCELSVGGVWSEYEGGADCLRYFASPGIDDSAVVIIVLRGDRDTWVGRKPEDIPHNTPSAQTELAAELAEEMGFPVIVLSRPGTFGSGGDHLRRRQPEEFLALAGALDDIRADHRIGRFVLLGHSGGATAAAALLTLGRDDIACAVLTSGAFDLLERAEALRAAQGRRSRPGLDLTGLPHPYDPLEYLDGIVNDTQRPIILIGNRTDQVTPFHFQRRFYEGLIARGHRAELREAAARPPNFHNLLGKPGTRAAAECAGEVRP